jgi:hypothetical protein
MLPAGSVTSGGRTWDFPGKALRIRHLGPGVLVAGPGAAAGTLAPAYSALMAERPRRARVEDVHQLAMSMPHVTVWPGRPSNPIYQVGGKSFVFFRTPRPDATDPETGERYPDVVMFWVPSESDKQALVQDVGSPFFTTAHFDGHPSVLLRASRVGQLTLQELTELIQDAWLSQASPRRAAAWLSAQQPGGQDR